MLFSYPRLRRTCVLALLFLAACRPDAPSTQQAPARPATQPAAATAPDTLHLPGGQVARWRASTAAAFEQLGSTETLPQEVDAETPEEQWLAATQGRVRRQGLDLLLQPIQGPLVRLSSTPEAEAKNDSATASYKYWGSLPAAHQWVVKAWYWESDGVLLVDQRTGRQLEVPGWPAASPDGGYVLATSPGLGGGNQVNSLILVKIDADGPRQLWQLEPTTWAPERARWSSPNRVLVQLSRPDANGELPEPPRPEYMELTLPAR